MRLITFHFLIAFGFLSGCLTEEFPTYVERVPSDAGRRIDEGLVNVDMGCGSENPPRAGEGCTLAGGLCGQWSCDSVCISSEAFAEDPPVAETCNGEDDDCDGLIDEDFNVGMICDEANFNGMPAMGKYVCNPAAVMDPDAPDVVCNCCPPDEVGCTRPCVQICEASEETCNGLDDNCNGEIDEGITGSCSYPLEGCFVRGVLQCDMGVETCLPPSEVADDCECLSGLSPNSSYYISCPMTSTWAESQNLCESLAATQMVGSVDFKPGRLLQIESGFEHWKLSDRLASTNGLNTSVWLNYDHRPSQTISSFDDWLSENFSEGAYESIETFTFQRDTESCLAMSHQGENEWRFTSCDAPGVHTTCEFCDEPLRDEDGDGHFACSSDCDDQDPDRHWGAYELCYNGRDDNCDGEVDEDCSCELRVYRNHQYVFCTDRLQELTWVEARNACQDFGMDLLIIDDLLEFEFVANAAPSTFRKYWVGLEQPRRGSDNDTNEMDRENPWIWIRTQNPEPANGPYWQDNDLARHDRANRDCAFINVASNTYLRPGKCSDEEAYICESITQTP